MCIGIPMQVIKSGEAYALCQSRDGEQQQQVDTLLVGDLPVGSWVLVFLGSAREVLDELTAHQITDALSALDIAMHSADPHHQSIDHLFADLVDREPQLPDFLQAQLADDKESS